MIPTIFIAIMLYTYYLLYLIVPYVLLHELLIYNSIAFYIPHGRARRTSSSAALAIASGQK